jgi:CSLREA domain-containing protein
MKHSRMNLLKLHRTSKLPELVLSAVTCWLVIGTGGAATFVVNSAADPGDGICDASECTLREAIDAANANPGPDVIAFNVPGSGVQTIRPVTQLPVILESVKIDGTTQPGFDSETRKPLIELDGSLCPDWTFGLRIGAHECEIRGLILNRFTWAGIYLDWNSGNCWVAGNFLGTDAEGVRALGNGRDGSVLIDMDGSSEGNRIGGPSPADRNVIAAVYVYPEGETYLSGACGIATGGNRTVIQGNYIGTDWTGESALISPTEPYIVRAGIGMFGGQNCQIGGAGPGEGNVISGCRGPNPDEWWHNGIGIELGYNPGTVILGNRIGTDKDGNGSIPNEIGIRVGGGLVQIGGTEPGAGNLISGNGYFGITLGSDCVVQGNFVGTDAAGLLAVPNAVTGVAIDGARNVIGGTEPGALNLISGNGHFHLSACGGGGNFNLIQGNYIGTDLTGTKALPGAPEAIGVYLCADDNIVGGTEPGAGNVISANSAGLDIRAHRNLVAGNLIGTDASGTLPLGNGIGIYLADIAQDNVIGGSEPGAGNVIADCQNTGVGGIWLNGPNVLRTIIQGNWIGVDRTGSIPLPNHGWGVVVGGNTDTLVGGVNPGEGNVIAHSENAGVWVSADEFYGVGMRNPIRGNSIYGNGWNTDPFSPHWPGIDLGEWGVTPNDSGDTDEGANRLQNFPVLTGTSSSATKTYVAGSLDSTPNTVFLVDFYANVECDESDHGEGERYLGFASVTTDNSGQAQFNAVLPVAVPPGQVITATATDPDGNTSEFSACPGPVSPAGLEVTIDIKPGSYPNSINLGSNGTVPVAIFSSAAFDAATVNPTTVSLAGATVKLRGKGTPLAVLEDVNGDGIKDLVVHVLTSALQLTAGDTQAIVEGETLDGLEIKGADSVRIVP